MTYCVAMLLDTGLVFLSDSRTSAGVDQINTFRKSMVFQKPGERVLVLLERRQSRHYAGRDEYPAGADRDSPDGGCESPYVSQILFEAARLVGDALREVHRRDASALKDFGLEFNASLILGGQIRGEAPRLFSIYAAGNFIEATHGDDDTSRSASRNTASRSWTG